jgi:hypothetical protein
VARMIALALLVAALCCARRQPAPETISVLPNESTARSDRPVVETPVLTGEAPANYPDTVEVERLLFRASELELRGQSEDALIIVSEAVAADPHSPCDEKMRERLEDLIRRIAITGSDHDPQFVTPEIAPAKQRTKG